MIDEKLLEILVCPKTKGPLEYHKELNELWSREVKLAYPVREGIPIMVVTQARELSAQDLQTPSPSKVMDDY